MQSSMFTSQTLHELATLRRQLARSHTRALRYRVGNEIFKRATALWRDGFLTSDDYVTIRDEVDAATTSEG